MELQSSDNDRVVFSVLYPSTFITLTRIDAVQQHMLQARVGDADADDIAQIESSLLKDLRDCSSRLFCSFRDEYSVMFRSAVLKRGSGKNRILLRLVPHSLRTSTPSDVSLCPERVIVYPGSVVVEWCVSDIDAPEEAPAALKANMAVGTVEKAQDALKKIRSGIEDGSTSVDSALDFLRSHGFLQGAENTHKRL